MVRNVLAWLLIVWAIVTCEICLLIVAAATHRRRMSGMRLPVRAGEREAAPAALRDRRHPARDAPIERDRSRPPEQTPPKRRHLSVV
jgi:hypothetical protein